MRAATAALMLLAAGQAPLSAAEDGLEQRLEQGRQLAMARNKGNCLACHDFDGGELPGTIGPPLVSMRLRFPDREVLRAQIWDPTERNPNTVMPPFGRHRILSDEEIERIVDYIQTL